MSNESLFSFSATTIKGEEKPLKEFQGNVVLVVNTASKCGFTPQFKDLEEMYQKYKDQGFVILGFPCNQFANQEYRDNGEIEGFCQKNYGVTFPMFARVDVNGSNAHPVFQFLKKEKPGIMGTKGIKWNFTKFLVDRSGVPVARFSPTQNPKAFAKEVEDLLATPAPQM